MLVVADVVDLVWVRGNPVVDPPNSGPLCQQFHVSDGVALSVWDNASRHVKRRPSGN